MSNAVESQRVVVDNLARELKQANLENAHLQIEILECRASLAEIELSMAGRSLAMPRLANLLYKWVNRGLKSAVLLMNTLLKSKKYSVLGAIKNAEVVFSLQYISWLRGGGVENLVLQDEIRRINSRQISPLVKARLLAEMAMQYASVDPAEAAHAALAALRLQPTQAQARYAFLSLIALLEKADRHALVAQGGKVVAKWSNAERAFLKQLDGRDGKASRPIDGLRPASRALGCP